MAKKTYKAPPQLRQLEEAAGHFMQYWGFKKIHGRIWAHIFTSDRPLDSAELITRLKMSKGLISLAVRDLLRHDVILESHTGKHGTVYYDANPDLMGVITGVLRSRETAMLSSAGAAANGLLKMKAAEIEKFALSREKIQIISNLVFSAQGLLGVFLATAGGDDGALFDSINPKEIQ